MTQMEMEFQELRALPGSAPRQQLLKWVGNKHRFVRQIISSFPKRWNSYFEPFLGSGAVLGALAPKRGVASDILQPLIDIWLAVRDEPETVKGWYEERWRLYAEGDAQQAYAEIRASYNRMPNPADLLFISRSCYGGVLRFRKHDGYISTPCGCHHPISPEAFAMRVDLWSSRIRTVSFLHSDFEPVMDSAVAGDIVYCDPPYYDTQPILYGAQTFSLPCLLKAIRRCKDRGVFVLLSIDGKKRSGKHDCAVRIPEGLFEREAVVDCGRSMLRRFQMPDATLEDEIVHDRLLMTW